VQRFSPPAQPRLTTRHPLTDRVIGAWAFTAAAGASSGLAAVDLWSGQDRFRTNSPGASRLSAAGPGWYGSAEILSSALSPRFSRSENVSLFWYGTVASSGGATNPPLVAHYHNASNNAPYISYGLHRPNSTDLWVAYNNAGTFGNLTASNAFVSADYDRPLAFGATFGTGSVRGYKNGREIVSGSGISGITYDTTHCLATYNVPQGAAFHGQQTTVLVYIFGTALSPTDHARLADNPWGLLDTGPQQAAGFTAGGGGGASEQARPFVILPA
jgi:hypothetical protein